MEKELAERGKAPGGGAAHETAVAKLQARSKMDPKWGRSWRTEGRGRRLLDWQGTGDWLGRMVSGVSDDLPNPIDGEGDNVVSDQ